MKVASARGREEATLVVRDGRVTLRIGAVERSAATDGGDVYQAFLPLAAELEREEMQIEACASCIEFRFSGMSRDWSNGTVGYCGRVAFRSNTGRVYVGDRCGEFERVPHWPEDDPLAWSARMARTRERETEGRSRLGAFEGAMLGLAIGDALGFPPEFRRRAQIFESFGPEGITDFVSLQDPRWPRLPMILGPAHPPGTFSDDTQMTIALAEGLLDGPVDDLDAVMNRVAQRFIAWSESPDNNRGPGSTCMTGCQHLRAGTAWRAAGVPDSKGCGSAMRVAPIGMQFWRDPARVAELARAQSLLTHGHDAGIEGAAAAALLVALALAKYTPRQMFDFVMKECAPRSADFAACFSRVPELLAAPPEVALSKEGLGEGWVAEEAVASALYCFWRAPDDFRHAVLTAANTDGDSDSIACIAGSISGAFNGIGSIPTEWAARVENAEGLRALARRLHDASIHETTSGDQRAAR